MRFTESSHQRFVRGKKTLKTEIFRLLFYAETEKYNQEDWNISDTFGIITLLLPTYHLEVGVPFSVKLATKASCESKKTFLNEKSRSATKKKSSLSDKFGMLLFGLDTYFLEVSAHPLLKVATKGSFKDKKSENLAFLGYFSKAKREECNKKD